MAEKELKALLEILSGERQILQRTDQKAFTLLSILGAFMVFFVVHFTKMNIDTFIFLLIIVYFPSAMATLYFLVRVLIPRVQGVQQVNNNPDEKQSEDINPTFFAGISKFNSPEDYAEYLKPIANDDQKLYSMFAGQVFALGYINERKNQNIRKALFFFVTALTSELFIIMYLAYLRASGYLGENIKYYIPGLALLSLTAILFSRYNLISKAKFYIKNILGLLK